MKKIYLIGKDINYSKSPLLQNAMLKELGRFDVEYEIKNLEEDDLEEFLEELETNDDILGANVTTPYKNIIGERCTDSQDPVNIIYKRNGELNFSSTDFMSAYEAISEKIPELEIFKIFLLGNGGVSDSMKERLVNISNEANDVTTFCRNPKTNKFKQYPLDKLSVHKNLSKSFPVLFINCTPVGMKENETLVPKELLTKEDVVFDMVYSPHETKMIKDAKEVGCEVVYGIDMLMYNSIFSLELFLNQTLDIPKMKEFLKNLL